MTDKVKNTVKMKKETASAGKKKNVRPLVTALVLLAAVLVPVLFVAGSLIFLPKVYSETFLGEMAEKYRLQTRTEEKKITVIGGSSVAFGLDSAEIEKATGYRAVNFGLYATLGTKIMLDLSESGVNSGDIVVIAPELDEQTLSLYFNAESAWQAIEGDLSMLFHVGRDNAGDLAGGLFDYLGKRYSYALKGEIISPNGIYRRDSFNAYGDISYPREYNVMTLEYDRSQPIRLEPSIFDGEFLDYLNDYIDRIKHRGATVFFAFCPMNRAALAEGTSDASIEAFYRFVCENIDCTVLGSPADSVYDKGYFYDTNYHLNDAGVRLHTMNLVNGILRETGRTDVLVLDRPDPPGKKPAETLAPGGEYTEDPFEKYFTYEPFGDGMRITGTLPEASSLESLEIPVTAQGRKVIILGENALKGCLRLSSLTVRDNLTLIEDGAFNGCSLLYSVHILSETPDSLEVSPNVFAGAPASLTVYLHTQSSYDSFTNGYWWTSHAARMKLAKD